MGFKSFLATSKPPVYSRWSYHREKIKARCLTTKPNGCTMIYIIRSKEHPVYKIGRTTEKRKGRRLKQLARKYGEIEVVHLIYSADPNFEQELHKIFRYQKTKVRNSREWFNLNQGDIDWLKTLKFIGDKQIEKKYTDVVGYLLKGGR